MPCGGNIKALEKTVERTARSIWSHELRHNSSDGIDCGKNGILVSSGRFLLLSTKQTSQNIQKVTTRGFFRKREFGHRIKDDPTKPTWFEKIRMGFMIFLPIVAVVDWTYTMEHEMPVWISEPVFRGWHAYRMMWRRWLELDTWEYENYDSNKVSHNTIR